MFAQCFQVLSIPAKCPSFRRRAAATGSATTSSAPTPAVGSAESLSFVVDVLRRVASAELPHSRAHRQLDDTIAAHQLQVNSAQLAAQMCACLDSLNPGDLGAQLRRAPDPTQCALLLTHNEREFFAFAAELRDRAQGPWADLFAEFYK